MTTIYPCLFFVILTIYGSTSTAGLEKATYEMSLTPSDTFKDMLELAVETGTNDGVFDEKSCTIRKAEEEKLSLKPANISTELQEKIVGIMNNGESKQSYYDTYCRSRYHPYRTSEPINRDHSQHTLNLYEALALLEKNQVIHLGFTRLGWITPTVYQSDRINNNIVKKSCLSNMPIAHIELRAGDTAECCLEVPNYHMGVLSYDEGSKYKDRYLRTKHVYDCIAIILWDRKKHKACMSHFERQDLNKQSLFIMKELISPTDNKNEMPFTISDKPLSNEEKGSAPEVASTVNSTDSPSEDQNVNSDIEMTAIGGRVNYLMEDKGVIPTLLEFAKENNIKINQTVLGENARTDRVFYDIKNGMASRYVTNEREPRHLYEERGELNRLHKLNQPNHQRNHLSLLPEVVSFKNNKGKETSYPVENHTSEKFISYIFTPKLSFNRDQTKEWY